MSGRLGSNFGSSWVWFIEGPGQFESYLSSGCGFAGLSQIQVVMTNRTFLCKM